MFTISGKVERPGNYELPLGTPFRVLLEDYAGGMLGGRSLKAWTPGGSSTPFLTAEHLDVGLDFESIAAAGSLLGTGACMVMDQTDCIVEAARRLLEFYAHESCGKCTPCREGTWWAERVLGRIEDGYGRSEDMPLLSEVGGNILFRAFCALADGAVSPISSTLAVLHGRVRGARGAGRCPLSRGGTGVRGRRWPPRERADGDAHDRRQGGHRARRHADHPRRRAARHRDPAVPRPPAAGSGRRVPPVLRRDRGPAQAVHVVHHDRRAGHGRHDAEHQSAGRGRAGREPGVPAAQPPARLPDLRPRRRVPAAGSGAHVRAGESRYIEAKRTYPKPLALSPLVGLDRERCVLCARCTRFCDQISGDRFIELFDRGAAEQVAIAPGEDFRSPFSGNTIQICPVGALTATPYRFVARPFDLSIGRHRVPALQRRLQHQARHAPRRGRAAAGARQPRGERRLALRQRAVRVPVPRRPRPRYDPADPRPRAGAGVVRRGARRRSPGGAPASASRS